MFIMFLILHVLYQFMLLADDSSQGLWVIMVVVEWVFLVVFNFQTFYVPLHWSPCCVYVYAGTEDVDAFKTTSIDISYHRL